MENKEQGIYQGKHRAEETKPHPSMGAVSGVSCSMGIHGSCRDSKCGCYCHSK